MHSNPFASKFIRPEANSYIFESGQCQDEMFRRLDRAGRRGQIIGPHGTGKSTLLFQLCRQLETENVELECVRLSSSERQLPISLPKLLAWTARHILVIDGFEQLRPWHRIVIKQIARWRKFGLLVTAHGDQGLATIAETSSTAPRLRSIIDRLDPDQRLGPISERALCKLLDTCDGNVREVLFQLYDRVSATSSSPASLE